MSDYRTPTKFQVSLTCFGTLERVCHPPSEVSVSDLCLSQLQVRFQSKHHILGQTDLKMQMTRTFPKMLHDNKLKG